MRSASKCLFFAQAAALGLILVGQATAQTFTTLYSFTNGTDAAGEPTGGGPTAGVISSGDTLYGTTTGYGGTVFALNTDGGGFTTLCNLHVGIGYDPAAGLILSGNTLYGTVGGYNGFGYGTVFAVNTDGTGFATLYSFTATSGPGTDGTNIDGSLPESTLVLFGDTLYGTATCGGSSGDGTIFCLNTNGTGFTTLHSFTAASGTNSDGAFPYAGLVLSGNTLYGTAGGGGTHGYGTVYAVNTDGTGFTTLYSFSAGNITNSDGGGPRGRLLLSGNTLYGTCPYGGSSDNGTVFAVNTDGAGFTVLHTFTEAPTRNGDTNSDGAMPNGGLILSGNALYGTADEGGSSSEGTVFSLSLPPVTPPQLAIALAGTNVVLTWPASRIAFTLQSTANLGSSAVWTPVSPAPVVINGQNTVTNPISGTQQFYQLSQ